MLESQLLRVVAGALGLAEPPTIDSPSWTGAALPGGRVLVVDDNDVARDLAGRLLERLGYDVELVADGFEAIARVAEATFDVILMDCQMPGMTGYEAATEIRRAEGPGRPNRIVAVTAHALGDERQRCLDAGMDDYLAKPFLPEQLAEMLARQLKGRSR